MNKSFCGSCDETSTGSSSVTGSKTTTITETKKENAPEPQILRLVVKEPPSDGKVSWTDDTLNNEGLGRKSSKRKYYIKIIFIYYIYIYLYIWILCKLI